MRPAGPVATRNLAHVAWCSLCASVRGLVRCSHVCLCQSIIQVAFSAARTLAVCVAMRCRHWLARASNKTVSDRQHGAIQGGASSTPASLARCSLNGHGSGSAPLWCFLVTAMRGFYDAIVNAIGVGQALRPEDMASLFRLLGVIRRVRR